MPEIFQLAAVSTPKWLLSLVGIGIGAGIGIVIGLVVVAVVKLIYLNKDYAALPKTRPLIGILPKYICDVPLGKDRTQRHVAEGLFACGFELRERTSYELVFRRGSALVMFPSSNIGLEVKVPLPVGAQAELRVRYAIIGGSLLDFGKLWKLCNKLVAELEERLSQPVEEFLPAEDAPIVESNNPYQSPRH